MEEMQIEMIPNDKVKPNPRNPREDFDEEEIKNLAESIEGSELLNPLSVRKLRKNYEVIAGDRRRLAFKRLGMDEYPCIVRDVDKFEAEKLGAIENYHREGLDQEEQIYNLWSAGKARGEWDSIVEMERKTGIEDSIIGDIIEEYEMELRPTVREKTTYQDIHRTKPLSQEEELRKQLLKKRAKKEIKATDLREFSKLIKKADEETKEVLLQPGVTMEEARKIVKQDEMEEALEEKAAGEDVSEEEKQEWQEKAEEAEETRDEILGKKETQKKGKLRRNWQDLTSVYARIKEITCPVCGESATGHLKFDCHDLTIEEAKDMAKEEYQKAINGGESK